MSIKKIAEMTGVSLATVSRVLNNPEYKCKDPAQRDLIWKAAMEINYVPNEAARNLRRKNSVNNDKVYYIQVLITRSERNHTDPFFSELLRIVESEIHKKSCILSEVWYKPVFSDDKECRKYNVENLVSELYSNTEGKSNGLVVLGRCNKEVLRALKKKFKNVVSINRNPTNYEIDEVTCDGRKIAQNAVEYLIKLGHTDIGYVGCCKNEARYKGYLETLASNEIEPEHDFIKNIRLTETDGYNAMEEILASDNIPTAIYCSNDIIAVGMLKALAKPKNRYYQISVISSDNIEESQYTNPMLTTVALPKEEMGRFAIDILISRIQGQHDSVITMEFGCKLIVRSSCSAIGNGMWDYYI